MKEPVDHIMRPRLPWRSPDDPAITECGYDASKVKTLSRSEFQTRLKDMGRQRCAMLTCMTCSDAAQRWPTWDDDPRKALEREIAWECRWNPSERGTQLRDELLAIAELVAERREDLEVILKRQAWIERKKAAAVTKPREGPKSI